MSRLPRSNVDSRQTVVAARTGEPFVKIVPSMAGETRMQPDTRPSGGTSTPKGSRPWLKQWTKCRWTMPPPGRRQTDTFATGRCG